MLAGCVWGGSFSTAYIPAPPLPNVSAGAGTQFTDPTFGSRMLRVTDGNTLVGTDPTYQGRSFGSGSSSENFLWGPNSDKVMVFMDGGWVLPYTFDGTNFTATRVDGGTGPYNGRVITTMGAEPGFSAYQDVIYGASGWEIRAMTWGVWTYTVVADLTGLMPDGTNLGGVSPGGTVSDRLCAWGNQDVAHWVVWFDAATPGTRYVLNTITSEINGVSIGHSLGGAAVHNARFAKDGRYISITLVGGGMVIWDTVTQTVSKSLVYGAGHKVGGMGYFINGDDMPGAVQFQLIRRLLSIVLSPIPILPRHGSPYTLTQDSHPSWANSQSYDLRPVCQANYSALNNDNNEPYGGEIICSYTDGITQQIERFGRHRTYYTAFEDSPRGNVSPNGRYYAFTSNWDRTLGVGFYTAWRQDMFIIDVTQTRLKPVVSACASGCTYATSAAAISAVGNTSTVYDIVTNSDIAGPYIPRFGVQATAAQPYAVSSTSAVFTFPATSACTISLYTDAARTTPAADTPTPQNCYRSGSLDMGGRTLFVAGTVAALAPNTTYYYTITDTGRLGVGTITTAAAPAAASHTFRFAAATPLTVCDDSAFAVNCTNHPAATSITVAPAAGIRYSRSGTSVAGYGNTYRILLP